MARSTRDNVVFIHQHNRGGTKVRIPVVVGFVLGALLVGVAIGYGWGNATAYGSGPQVSVVQEQPTPTSISATTSDVRMKVSGWVLNYCSAYGRGVVHDFFMADSSYYRAELTGYFHMFPERWELLSPELQRSVEAVKADRGTRACD